MSFYAFPIDRVGKWDIFYRCFLILKWTSHKPVDPDQICLQAKLSASYLHGGHLCPAEAVVLGRQPVSFTSAALSGTRLALLKTWLHSVSCTTQPVIALLPAGKTVGMPTASGKSEIKIGIQQCVVTKDSQIFQFSTKIYFQCFWMSLYFIWHL